jgi:hypothetical protein
VVPVVDQLLDRRLVQVIRHRDPLLSVLAHVPITPVK